AQAVIKVGASSAPCTAKRTGTLRYITGLGLEVCNGSAWQGVNNNKTIHYLGTCSSNGSSGTRTFCLSKTLTNTAGDYLSVNTTNASANTDYNTGRVTIKKAGHYRVDWNQRSRGSKQAWIYINSQSKSYAYDQGYSSYYGHMSGSRIFKLKVGDYINMRFSSNYTAWYANDSTLGVTYLGE
ncbi:MAG TPA: hypothetical protein DCQ06_09465, partial [Myxococcales bacterium]|nr:hypothetical protein [Myxococcales bacterium]